MDKLQTKIYYDSSLLPQMSDKQFFHSAILFDIYYHTPRHNPFMITVEDNDHKVVSCLLAVIRHRTSWLPPYVFSHCRIYGEGAYFDDSYSCEQLFAMMTSQLNTIIDKRIICVEWSNISKKMFGYKTFRDNDFVPVHWMHIHNSLHSELPINRISKKALHKVESAEKRGVITYKISMDDTSSDNVCGSKDLSMLMSLLHKHNVMKPKRYIPDKAFFDGIAHCSCGNLFITKYKGVAIGCSVCIISNGNAYLWYSAFLRKSHHLCHPDYANIWHVINYAYNHNCEHIHFMDVGLPFRSNIFRDFILKFGGKPTSTYRWFRFSNKFINNILYKIFSD